METFKQFDVVHESTEVLFLTTVDGVAVKESIVHAVEELLHTINFPTGVAQICFCVPLGYFVSYIFPPFQISPATAVFPFE